MAVDLRKIKKLIELVQTTGVAEIEIKEGEETVRITREFKGAPPVYMAPAAGLAPSPSPTSTPQTPAQAAAPQATQQAPQQATPQAESKHHVKAPMVGTVYLSSTPGSKPFAEIGQTVKVGDVICLIEAMKMFNQIEADKAGTITARLVDNGTPVEFNQPLFTIE